MDIFVFVKSWLFRKVLPDYFVSGFQKTLAKDKSINCTIGKYIGCQNVCMGRYCVMFPYEGIIGEPGLLLILLLRKKRIVTSRTYFVKTWDRLDYCPHIQQKTLFFQKGGSTFPDSVFVFKMCTSGDLHHPIRRPASHHLGAASHHPRICITHLGICITLSGTCITPFWELHHTIRGSASPHPGICITLSGTCITPSG